MIDFDLALKRSERLAQCVLRRLADEPRRFTVAQKGRLVEAPDDISGYAACVVFAASMARFGYPMDLSGPCDCPDCSDVDASEPDEAMH